MKRLILSLTISLCALAASAQIRTAYFMEGSYFRSDMNPALIPDRGYFTVPVISGLGMGINNNFLSVDNFIYSRDGETVTALDSRVGTSEFIDKLPKNGHFDFNANINLFSAGFSTRKMFWSFGANVRANVDMNVGKNLFYAMKNIGNGTYDLSSVSFDGSAYSEIHNKLDPLMGLKENVIIGKLVPAGTGMRCDEINPPIYKEEEVAEISEELNLTEEVAE